MGRIPKIGSIMKANTKALHFLNSNDQVLGTSSSFFWDVKDAVLCIEVEFSLILSASINAFGQ